MQTYICTHYNHQLSVIRVHREVPTYVRLVPLPGDREATESHLLPLCVILWPL
jgi:hypothetical protein